MEKEIGWLLQEKYHGRMTVAAKRDIARLKAGEPLDHIIGFVDFFGAKILAGKDALIPRVETEFWVGQAIDQVSQSLDGRLNFEIRVLDVFAGSGCIGISIVRHIKGANVVFAESEKPALQQIEKNCTQNKITKNTYQIVQSDIFSNITGQFNYIFANPPYIPTENAKKIQASVANYEPHAALFGGKDGLLYIKSFLEQAKQFLAKNGKLYMEFDSPQKLAIAPLLKKLQYKSWQFHKDQYNQWRWVVVNN